MQYRRIIRICIENPRRFARHGAYCLDSARIQAIPRRAIEMSLNFYAIQCSDGVLHEKPGLIPANAGSWTAMACPLTLYRYLHRDATACNSSCIRKILFGWQAGRFSFCKMYHYLWNCPSPDKFTFAECLREVSCLEKFLLYNNFAFQRIRRFVFSIFLTCKIPSGFWKMLAEGCPCPSENQIWWADGC